MQGDFFWSAKVLNKYFGKTGFERLHLFEALRDRFGLKSAIYPGSFVHITPAFVFQKTAFIDNDRRVEKFFNDKEVVEMVIRRKQYSQEPDVFTSQQSYEEEVAVPKGSFDLLISQYAGFVSQAGKRYLQIGGILLANNSHGDAAMAYVDPDYELIAVTNHSNGVWRINNKDLSSYFIPKKGIHPTKTEIQASTKGVGYTKSAANYIFRKVS